jgi:hypothetical protein
VLLPATRVTMTMMVGLSSSGAGYMEPSTKKTLPWPFLPVYSRYGIVHRFTPFPFFLFLF